MNRTGLVHFLLAGQLVLGAAADACDAPLWGVRYSPFRDGQSPASGVFPSLTEIKKDLAILKNFTGRIATYSVDQTLGDIPRLARKRGLECYVGAWLDANQTQNAQEITRLIEIARADKPTALIVGNEVLFRGDLPSEQLIGYIRQVKQSTTLPVGYTDTWAQWLAHPEVAAEVDFLLINIHPYWEGIPVTNAAEYVRQRWTEVRDAYPLKTVIIGETGWPTAGATVGSAVPSEDNLCMFLRDFTAIARTNGIPYFLFEAFDEAWKALPPNPAVEGHWGLANSSRIVKPCVLAFLGSQATVQIQKPAACGGGPNSWGKIGGKVCGLSKDRASAYRVVIYAHTDKWYVQPFVDRPFTRIKSRGRWQTHTHLGDKYAAVLWRLDCGSQPPAILFADPQPDGECVVAVTITDCPQ